MSYPSELYGEKASVDQESTETDPSACLPTLSETWVLLLWQRVPSVSLRTSISWFFELNL